MQKGSDDGIRQSGGSCQDLHAAKQVCADGENGSENGDLGCENPDFDKEEWRVSMQGCRDGGGIKQIEVDGVLPKKAMRSNVRDATGAVLFLLSACIVAIMVSELFKLLSAPGWGDVPVSLAGVVGVILCTTIAHVSYICVREYRRHRQTELLFISWVMSTIWMGALTVFSFFALMLISETVLKLIDKYLIVMGSVTPTLINQPGVTMVVALSIIVVILGMAALMMFGLLKRWHVPYRE